MAKLTALGIPCPWSGDESDPITWRYRLWFRLYRESRNVRHALSVHDWLTSWPAGDRRVSCTWYGERRA